MKGLHRRARRRSLLATLVGAGLALGASVGFADEIITTSCHSPGCLSGGPASCGIAPQRIVVNVPAPEVQINQVGGAACVAQPRGGLFSRLHHHHQRPVALTPAMTPFAVQPIQVAPIATMVAQPLAVQPVMPQMIQVQPQVVQVQPQYVQQQQPAVQYVQMAAQPACAPANNMCAELDALTDLANLQVLSRSVDSRISSALSEKLRSATLQFERVRSTAERALNTSSRSQTAPVVPSAMPNGGVSQEDLSPIINQVRELTNRVNQLVDIQNRQPGLVPVPNATVIPSPERPK